MRTRTSLTCFATLALCTACGTTPIAGNERTATTRTAIVGGTDDISSDVQKANVVVRLGGQTHSVTSVCSGTLLTPTAVLTAGHCYYGFVNTPEFEIDGKTQVPISVSTDTMTIGEPTYLNLDSSISAPLGVPAFSIPDNGSPAVLLTDPNSGTLPLDEVKNDLAIFFLDAKILNADFQAQHGIYAQSGWKTFLEVERGGTLLGNDGAGRLSLATPTLASGSLVGGADAAGFAPDHTFRQLATLMPPKDAISEQNGTWQLQPGGTMQGGDSGGPLFTVRTDGSREVFGVHSEGPGQINVAGQPDVWTDITSPARAAWIRSIMEDHSHDSQATWLSRHPGYKWKGEVEYTGACRSDVDTDCDHWTDVHDNCPFVFNPDQTDTNDDGAGDACPTCPCDPDNDADHDLVCGSCQAVANGYCNQCSTNQGNVDNCPFVWNSDQSNCNADAETTRGATALGDVCDPVPCPASSAQVVSTPDPCGAEQMLCSHAEVRSTINTVKNPSFESEALVKASGQPVLFPTLATVPSVATDSRFCQSNLTSQPPYNCHDAAAINDSELAFDVAQNPAHPWHQITLSGTSGRGATWSADYDFSSINQTWDYATDETYWFGATPKIVPDADGAEPCRTISHCLNGTFWSHAESLVGSDSAHDAIGTTTVGSHGTGLANHYFDIDPERVVTTIHFVAPEIVLPYIPWLACPACGIQDTFDPEVGIILPIESTKVGYLQEGRRGVDYTAFVSTQMRSELVNPAIRWFGVAEPGTRGAGRLGLSFVGMALTADATRLVDLAVTQGTRLLTATELLGGGDPPARANFVGVFSRAAGAVFVLGGDDPSSGAPMHDMWVQVVGQDWRQIVAPGFSPSTIVAGTFSFMDGNLWVLDEVEQHGASSTARLTRVDPFARSGAVATAVAQWPTGASGTYYLAVDKDGSILVSRTNPTRRQSTTVKVSVEGERRICLTHPEKGNLDHAPLVDDYGYSFVIRDDKGGLSIQRTVTLGEDRCQDNRGQMKKENGEKNGNGSADSDLGDDDLGTALGAVTGGP